MKNEEISDKLHISVHTTKAHLEMIYENWELKIEFKQQLKAIDSWIFYNQ